MNDIYLTHENHYHRFLINHILKPIQTRNSFIITQSNKEVLTNLTNYSGDKNPSDFIFF